MKLPCVDRFAQAPVVRSFKPKRGALAFQRKVPSKNDLCSCASKIGLKAFFIGERYPKSSLT
jgi:hypothetical protein